MFTSSGTPEQARPARPRSGLDFSIHNVEAIYLVIIFKGFTTNYRSGFEKISSGVPEEVHRNI